MFELIFAFGLDLLIGDPEYTWHPVRMMGHWIKGTEAWLRARVKDERLAGLVQALAIPIVVYLSVWFLIELANQMQPFLGGLLTLYFFYTSISVKDLAVEAKRVSGALRKGNLEAARKNLARIVGRDTQNLDQAEIIRGTVETVAESFVDGVLSPLFYAALGGAPLAMAYKAVNTLDSMVGKKTSPYRDFGFAAAKIDEIFNWIPARISWFLIGMAAFMVNGRGLEAWRVGIEDGAATSFVNSAVPEAAFAGALGVELGGTNYYGGEAVQTPRLGYPVHSLEREGIRLAVTLMQASSVAALVFAVILQYVVRLISRLDG